MLLLFVQVAQTQASIIVDAQPDTQNVVQVAVTDIPSSFYPYADVELPEHYSHLFFDPLLRWGNTKQLEYRLLDKFKTINSRKTRFYLKKKIYFHSGNSLTSNDVIWSLKEVLKISTLKKEGQETIKITRVNNHQFDIESQFTQAQLLDYLTHIFILDSRFYKSNKIDHNTPQKTLPHPISKLPLSGTGPYQVAGFYAGVNLSVQENRHYWQNQPIVKRLNFIKIQSPESRLYALLANDIDISEQISNKNIETIRLSGSKRIYQTSASNVLFLTINDQNNTIFSQERARNAIHLAINQAGIIKHILNGTGSIDRVFKVNKSEPSLPIYDVKRAKSIFKKIRGPKKLSLLVLADDSIYNDKVIFALINMLKKLEVSLEVTQAETRTEWKALQFKHDLALSMWRTSLIEEHGVYQDIFAHSLLQQYLTLQFEAQEQPLAMADKIQLFEQLQLSDTIIPLFSKNKIWASDKQFDLTHLFSINGIPYWHLLTIND
ncbi:hypothetical protein GCM10007916_26690 [Psychromonas marina]|uniref:Solute-binding protein family 5 domain-containing protein n=2 Tax=Psychromonas marina TaxID=88364 RepID=A0ABQ6E2Q5_9GAMM|nr:hypothetical protein GCM10007916_26690 [Psychromonas marina]